MYERRAEVLSISKASQELRHRGLITFYSQGKPQTPENASVKVTGTSSKSVLLLLGMLAP